MTQQGDEDMMKRLVNTFFIREKHTDIVYASLYDKINISNSDNKDSYLHMLKDVYLSNLKNDPLPDKSQFMNDIKEGVTMLETCVGTYQVNKPKEIQQNQSLGILRKPDPEPITKRIVTINDNIPQTTSVGFKTATEAYVCIYIILIRY